MKRQLKELLVIAALVLSVSGCGIQDAQNGEVIQTEETDPSADRSEDSEETVTPEQGEEKEGQRGNRPAEVRIALVTDVSSVTDQGFNEAALKGIETYAGGAGVSYACYSAEEDKTESYKDSVLEAIRNEAELVVCAGSHFENVVESLQEEYADIYFLLLDGVPRDSAGEMADIAPNVHCITYKEEEAGYLVGYMAVQEGYRKLGFIGGEQLPSVERYGYGYLQGIDDAAAALELADEIQVEYWYGDTFLADEEIVETAREWYENGTEVIFTCGGSIYQSVLSSAEACDGMMIGADVDQSEISERFLTSAMKGIDSSIIVALDDFFASGKRWPKDLAGKVISYGAKEKCISLPVQKSAWRFQNATTDEYLKILARLRYGDIEIPIDPKMPPERTVMVTYHNQREENDP